jgi:hypothetical protein
LCVPPLATVFDSHVPHLGMRWVSTRTVPQGAGHAIAPTMCGSSLRWSVERTARGISDRGQRGGQSRAGLRPLRHPCCPIYPRDPYLPKAAKGPGNDASTSVSVNRTPRLNPRPARVARARSTSEPANGEQPRVFEDRFQRNGVILDQRHGVRNGDTAAVSRGGAAGFTATFEIAAADEAGDGRVKRRPIR